MNKKKLKEAGKPVERPKRTKEEITQEYTACANSAGDLNYRIAVMEEDLKGRYRRMFELNQEAKALGAAPEAPPVLGVAK